MGDGMKKANMEVVKTAFEPRKITMSCPTCGGNGVLFVMNDEQECHRCEGTGQVEMEI
jgi:DnaJ-class molecular chaperone